MVKPGVAVCRRSSLDWQSPGGVSVRRASATTVSFTGSVAGSHVGGPATQTYTPFAVLAAATPPTCIAVCCGATVTMPTHLPVTAWTRFPAPCSAAGQRYILAIDVQQNF